VRSVTGTPGTPVFCRGTVPTDSNGRSEVRAHNVPVVIDGVRIEPGDLVVADDDGVVIVPQALIDKVVAMALEKDAHESQFRAAVADGMSATAAFAKFGVL
jgi:4-hydroxy-4-methyl-2-oxoglutarate aldolase